MTKHNLLSKDPVEIRQMWYIPPKPQYNTSWILYTKEFVLESIQKSYGYPEKVKRNFVWHFVSRCLWAGMVLTQLVLMTGSNDLGPVMGYLIQNMSMLWDKDVRKFRLR